MTTKYFIYTPYDVPQFDVKPKGLLKVENEDNYDGFSNLVDAEKWIKDHGVRNVEYVIIQVYKNP